MKSRLGKVLKIGDIIVIRDHKSGCIIEMAPVCKYGDKLRIRYMYKNNLFFFRSPGEFLRCLRALCVTRTGNIFVRRGTEELRFLLFFRKYISLYLKEKRKDDNNEDLQSQHTKKKTEEQQKDDFVFKVPKPMKPTKFK